MTAFSKKKQEKKKSKPLDVITKVSRTPFKSKDKLEKKKKITKVASKNEVIKNEKKENKVSSLKKGFSKKKSQQNDSSKNLNDNASLKQNGKKDKNYLKELKKKDPEFFKAIFDSPDVLEGTGCSDDDFDDETDDENDFSEEDSDSSAELDNKSKRNGKETNLKKKLETKIPVVDNIGEDYESEDDEDYEVEDEMGEEEESSDELEVEEEEESSDELEEEALEEFEEETMSNNEAVEDDDEEENISQTKESNTMRKGGKITKKLIKQWKEDIQRSNTSMSTFKCAEQALAAAILSIKGSDDNNLHSPYTVEGPQMFNSVVTFCLSDVTPALQKFFELKSLSDRPTKNHKWRKLISTTSQYLKHITMLTKSITEASGIEVLLKKGILPILPLYVEFTPIGWNLIKHLITLWCTSFEKVRVLALVAIFRLIRSFKEELKEKCMKALYMSYVKNCHFTSPISWPMINFMRMSLVELYGLDQTLAYRHAFIYIRQLALHLRNAIIVQKKERMILVYNWQFIHCIHFWAELFGKTHPSKVLQPLIYPLIQVSIGTIGLMESPKYYPLVLHVCNILTELSRSTGTFIPVMPSLLKLLSSKRICSRPSKNSIKPLQWDSIIKVSDAQLNESAFTDGLVDQLYDSLLRYLNAEGASIGFPELVFPATMKIKTYLNKCKVPNYCKKMKQLLEKIKENSNFIELRRREVQFGIGDYKAVKDWEIATRQASPPICTLYSHWRKVKDRDADMEKKYSTNNHEKFTDEPEATEALLKEKLAKGAEKKKGSHLLVKKDEEEMEKEVVEEDEAEVNEESNKSNKRKDTSSDSEPAQPSKKKRTSEQMFIDDDDNLEEDIIQEMKLSDHEESSSEEEDNDDKNENSEEDDNNETKQVITDGDNSNNEESENDVESVNEEESDDDDDGESDDYNSESDTN